MKLLLTSSGVTNESIHRALVELLGKPVSESSALMIPTAIYPFPGGGRMAWRAMTGQLGGPLFGLGWKSLGVLELTALPSIDREAWLPMVQETDALLVWGGDPLYLSHWMWQSGLAEQLPSLVRKMVYVGVSAGAMAASKTFAETYHHPPKRAGEPLASEEVVFTTPQGDLELTLATIRGVGLVDFAVIPHLEHPEHREASWPNAERWAAKVPVPTYAIDDQTALKVTDGGVDVVSEGQWKLFAP